MYLGIEPTAYCLYCFLVTSCLAAGGIGEGQAGTAPWGTVGAMSKHYNPDLMKS